MAVVAVSSTFLRFNFLFLNWNCDVLKRHENQIVDWKSVSSPAGVCKNWIKIDCPSRSPLDRHWLFFSLVVNAFLVLYFALTGDRYTHDMRDNINREKGGGEEESEIDSVMRARARRRRRRRLNIDKGAISWREMDTIKFKNGKYLPSAMSVRKHAIK